MKARVIEGAGRAFLLDQIRQLKGVTKEASKYADKLVVLEGKIFNVRRTYDKRIVLEYQEIEISENGKEIVGIDVEQKYVELIER